MTITSGSARVAGVDVDRRSRRARAGGSASRCRRPGSTRARPAASCWSCRPGCSASRGRRPPTGREELLELVDLVEAADRRIKGYSGGMKRRLDLASALVHEPEVLFLDEPTTGLDPASRLTVWDEVRRINERGTTVFLTTQYLEEADQLCDRLAIIDDGLIVREGTPSELKAELQRAARARPTSRRSTRCSSTPPAAPASAVAGEVQEVTGMSAGLVLGAARRSASRCGRPRRCCRRCSSRCSSSWSTSARPRKIFPSGTTPFLEGQNYAAFQLPSSLLLAASFGTRRAVPRRGHRGRLLRQAARRAGVADRHRASAGSSRRP